MTKVKSSLKTFSGQHHNHYGISVSHDHGYVPLVVIVI